MKQLEIDFLRYAHPRTYVLVNPEFRHDLLEKAIKKVGTKRKLAKIIGVNKGTLNNWKNNVNYNIRKIPLLQLVRCCKILGTSTDELRNNIKCATLRYPAGDIKIGDWNIKFDDEFAEWFGMLDGDGSASDRDVSFSNTYFDLTFYFAKFLQDKFGIGKDRIKMVVTYYEEGSFNDANKIAAQLRQRGYARVKVYMTRKHMGKKINLRVQVSFRVLSQFLLNIRTDLRNILKSSPNSVKSAYLRGFSAAEGCASESKTNVRTVTITQKSDGELNFIRFLLEDVGIRNVAGPRWTGRGFQLGITSQRELENFQRIVGFGHHENKNKKLKDMLEHYKFTKYREVSVRGLSCPN